MSEEDRKAILGGCVKGCELIRKGDAAGYAELYTEDAVGLPPNSDMIKGRKAVKDAMEGAFAAGLKDMETKPVEVIVAGDIAVEVATYVQKFQPKGQKAFEDRGKYVTVWKRTPKGWKVYLDIWNTSLPPPK